MVLLESWLNLEAHKATCLDFCKSCNCILNKGNVMPIMEPFVFHIFAAHKYFRKFETKMVGSLLNVETIHNQNL